MKLRISKKERAMRKIKKLILHVSDSPDTMDVGVKQIREWHVKGNGWSDIGYHVVIRRDGSLELGRPYDVVGAHTKGHNTDSIGICWVGRVKPSIAQYQSLVNTFKVLMAAHGLKLGDIYGHTELNAGKSCPNLDMNKFRGDIK